MTILILCNIGNSDLIVDSARVPRPRSEGERYWQHYSEHRFALPIIEPCLRVLLDQGQPLDRLVCFYTDQPATAQTLAPDRHGISLRDKDTLWFAQIAERLLRDQLGDRLTRVDRVLIERGDGQAINPSLYDEAFDAYGDLMARLYNPAVTVCYVLMSGGIPACNIALQIQALSAFGERCRFLYQPEGGSPYELRVGTQIQATFRRATALEALARQDFATALRNVEQLDAPAPGLLALLRYACYREAFDFDRARASLNKGISQASGAFRTFLATLQPDLTKLVDRADSAALLREVHASAQITFRNQRYADFLGRVFRFQEAALRFVVEDRLQLPTDMRKPLREANLQRFLQGIAANPALQGSLDTATIDGKALHYSDGPNRAVMQRMLDFLAQGGLKADGTPYLSKSEQGRFQGLKKAMGQIDKLAELRNQSIVAHGYAGVSREELDAIYGGDASGIIDEMEKVFDLVGLGRVESPFVAIAEAATEQLRRSIT
jgi:hypothetical protein